MRVHPVLTVLLLGLLWWEPCLAQGSDRGQPTPPPYSGTPSTTRQETESDPKRYLIFIHAGKEHAALVEQMRKTLLAESYIVKNANDNAIGAPGIDYFRDEDKAGAEAIALLLDPVLKLSPRRSSVSNPPGFIGVWLPASSARGWYYLGKISENKEKLLKSSAKDDVIFSPPIVEGRNLVDQIKPNVTEIIARGNKYLRSEDSKEGSRVQASVTGTLAPGTRVRVLQVDSSGSDPEDGQTVLWALVEVLATR